MATVDLQNISKEFPGGVQAVRDVTLAVQDREFLVLVGPSGCGKSTLLRLIAGLEDVTLGQVLIDGGVMNNVAPKDRDIAMVFQNYALYPHMSVYKNMAFGLKLRKHPKTEIDARVREAAAILGIEELLERKPKALSGGQRQRVAVGRAIVRHPKVFLFDEPLSNLDAKLRIQMRAEISRLHNQLQTTMIYVTHDQVEAMTMGHRIVVLLDGAVQQVAPPMELYNRPVNQFVASFIGSPPMNFVPGLLRGENGSLTFRDESGAIELNIDAVRRPALEPHADKSVVLGVRPHDFTQARDGVESGQRALRATVDVVEPMGSETYVRLTAYGQPITARLTPDDVPKVGDECRLHVDMAKCHFFDLETQANIGL